MIGSRRRSSKLRSDLVQRRKNDRRLEAVTAGHATPRVADTALVEVFGPVRRKQPSTALWTIVLFISRQTRLRLIGVQCPHGSLPAQPLLPRLALYATGFYGIAMTECRATIFFRAARTR